MILCTNYGNILLVIELFYTTWKTILLKTNTFNFIFQYFLVLVIIVLSEVLHHCADFLICTFYANIRTISCNSQYSFLLPHTFTDTIIKACSHYVIYHWTVLHNASLNHTWTVLTVFPFVLVECDLHFFNGTANSYTRSNRPNGIYR